MGEIDVYKKVGIFNTPIFNNRRTRHVINKEIEDLNNMISQIDLKDIYRTFHTTASEYMVFSGAYETFPDRS